MALLSVTETQKLIRGNFNFNESLICCSSAKGLRARGHSAPIAPSSVCRLTKSDAHSGLLFLTTSKVNKHALEALAPLWELTLRSYGFPVSSHRCSVCSSSRLSSRISGLCCPQLRSAQFRTGLALASSPAWPQCPSSSGSKSSIFTNNYHMTLFSCLFLEKLNLMCKA